MKPLLFFLALFKFLLGNKLCITVSTDINPFLVFRFTVRSVLHSPLLESIAAAS
jgi:hypothetical protein